MALFSLLVLFGAQPAAAINGFKLTAQNARSGGMGGATLASGGSVTDLATNPAHLANLKRSVIEGGAGIFFSRAVYEDSFMDPDPEYAYSNKVASQSSPAPLPYFGFAGPLRRKMGWGLALYPEGGVVIGFKNITRITPEGLTLNQTLAGAGPVPDIPLIGRSRQIKESLDLNIKYLRLTPGFAMKFDRLSLGFGVDVGLMTAQIRITNRDPYGLTELPGGRYPLQERSRLFHQRDNRRFVPGNRPPHPCIRLQITGALAYRWHDERRCGRSAVLATGARLG